LTFTARERDFGVERDQTRARIGQRIACREIPADGAHVPDARLSDFAEGFVQKRVVLFHRGRKLDVAMARAGADAQAVVGLVCNSVELRDARKADHDFGHQQSLAHHDEQRSPAGDHARIIAVLFEQAERLFQRGRFLVIKANHDFILDFGFLILDYGAIKT